MTSRPASDQPGPLPLFLDRGWLRLTTAQMINRVSAALAEERRRGERAAKARRRAVARNCAHWLERDRKRKLGASRARWAAWKAQQKEGGNV